MGRREGGGQAFNGPVNIGVIDFGQIEFSSLGNALAFYWQPEDA